MTPVFIQVGEVLAHRISDGRDCSGQATGSSFSLIQREGMKDKRAVSSCVICAVLLSLKDTYIVLWVAVPSQQYLGSISFIAGLRRLRGAGGASRRET